jgi:hypothetical protein
MTDNEALCWAAGFLEGEGSFIYHNWTPAVLASQVEKEPLEKIQILFGGNLRLCSRQAYRNKGQNAKDIWRWDIFGVPAIFLMFRLYPLMSRKRQEQISSSLEKVLAQGNRKHLSAISDQILKIS